MRTRTAIRLSCLNVGLMLLLGGYLVIAVKVEPDLERRPMRLWSPAESLEMPALPQEASKDILRGAMARPLFQKSRRPFTPTAPVVEEEVEDPVTRQSALPPPDTGAIALAGLLRSEGTRKVLVTSPEHPEGEWRGLGSQILGWTVQSLDDDGVTLTFENHERQLKLYDHKNGTNRGILP